MRMVIHEANPEIVEEWKSGSNLAAGEKIIGGR